MVVNISPHLSGGWLLEIMLALFFGVGLVINQASLAGIYKSFSTIFNEQLTVTKAVSSRFSMRIPSTGSEIDHKWLGAIPMLREWIGERLIKNLEALSYVIKNKDFEGTVAVLRLTRGHPIPHVLAVLGTLVIAYAVVTAAHTGHVSVGVDAPGLIVLPYLRTPRGTTNVPAGRPFRPEPAPGRVSR